MGRAQLTEEMHMFTNIHTAAVPLEVNNFQRAVHRMLRDPRYCTVAMYMMEMEIIPDEKVKTAATDCVRKIWYAPTYFAESSVDDCVSALVHEVYHKFLNFFPRYERWVRRYQHTRLTRRQLLYFFNQAQDYFINYMLKHEWRLNIRDDWMYDARYSPDKYTTEAIADELVKKELQKPASQPPAGTQPPCEGGSGSKSDKPKADKADAGDKPEANDADDEDKDEEQKAKGEGEGDGADEGEDGDDPADDAGDADKGEGKGKGKGEGERDLTQPENSQAGAGTDIVLPDEYKGDIDTPLTDEQLHSMELSNVAAAANAERMAAPMRSRGEGVEGSDPFTGELGAMTYKARHRWDRQLNRYANANMRAGSYTYSRPSTKRRTSQGAMYPGPVGKELGTVVFIIDSSGSTSGPMVDYFFFEMENALRLAMFQRAVVIWCSDGIPQEGVFEYTKSDLGKLDRRIRRVGGGTEFMPAFQRVADDYPDAACMTYLTDGGVDDMQVDECFAFWNTKLRRMPLIWALGDLGWSCTEHFTVKCNQMGFGVVAELPMEQLT